MARRLDAGEPFHLATLLRGASVDLFPEPRDRLLALPLERRRELLREALVAGGTRPEVASAVTSVSRHLLVRDELAPRAYLDEYHAANAWSGLTPQSLVATMLERLAVGPGARVLELGVGSGFHALATLRLGAELVVGVETDGEVLAATHERLAGLADTARLTLLHAADANAALAGGPYDRVYATFAYTSPVAALLPLVVDGGLVQVPRPVLAHELAREPLLRQERERYGTFERFFESWQSHLCLTTYRREGERLRVVDKLYAVQFVGQRDEVVPAPGARGPAAARC